VLGSDYAFDMGLEDPVGAVQGADLSVETVERILRTNAGDLLRPRAVS